MAPRKSKKPLRQTTLVETSPLIKQNTTAKRLSGASKVEGKVNHLRVTNSPDDSDIGAIQFAPKPETISSDDGDGPPTPSKLTHKRNLSRILTKSSSEEKIQSKPRISNVVDSEVEDATPRKRARFRRRWSKASIDRSSDEVDEEYIVDKRFRPRNKQSAYQKNLEKLRRRKLKIREPQDDDTSEDNEPECSDKDEAFKPFKGSKLSNLDVEKNHSDSESNSSDFIVEDHNVFQLPAQFSMESHEDLSRQFKKIFQFFIHIAVQPSGSREFFMKDKLANEEYFSVPLQVMRRKLLGIRDSLVSSSVWKSQFKKNLEKHPEFSLDPLEFSVPYCDACHLGGRMSTLLGRLMGPKYNPVGFDSLVYSDGEDADDIAEYHLGRFCARRTRVYHEFSHWEYALFRCISREIDELRHSSSGRGFHKVAYFRGMEPPGDLSDADALCDWLDQRRIIDVEWQKLKAMMESAHHLEIHSKGGEIDD